MTGRPTKLTKEMVEKAETYLDQFPKEGEIPIIEGLALFLDLHKDTLYAWEGGEKPLNRSFSDVMRKVRDTQAVTVINGSAHGKLNPTISKVLLTKHGYIDRSEVDNNHAGAVSFVNDVPRPKKANNANSKST